MNDILNVSEQLTALLRGEGIGVYEVCVSESEKRELNTEKADFTLFRTIFDRGVSVTVIQDGRKGAASGNDLSRAGLEKVVADALAAAASAIPDEANVIAEREEPEVFHTGCYEADMPRLYDSLQAMMETIGRDYPRVNLMQVIADHTRSHKVYINANGTRFEHFDGAYSVTLEMSGSDGEKNTGLDYVGLITHDLDTPLLMQGSLTRHLKDTEASLNSVPLPGKFEGSVILTPDCLGNFIYMLASNYIMGSVIMNGTSQWLNRIGEQVASELLTVSLKPYDERIVDGERSTSDGYRTEDVKLIDRGVLKTHVLNLYTAKKTGRPVVKNTGYDFVMEGGTTPLANMIASVDRGLLLGGFSGGEPGTNGEFSGVAKNSFLIENGKVKCAVTETMVNGNLGELVKNIRAVSREICCDGNTVMPYFAADGVVISGK